MLKKDVMNTSFVHSHLVFAFQMTVTGWRSETIVTDNNTFKNQGKIYSNYRLFNTTYLKCPYIDMRDAMGYGLGMGMGERGGGDAEQHW